MTSSRRRIGRLLTALVLFGALSSAIHRPAAHAQEDANPIDLASIILTNTDLEDAGIEDYVIRGASPYALADDAFFLSGSQELGEDEVAEGLEDAGYIGSYVQTQHIPSDLDAPGGASAQLVATRVYAFEDASGAEDGYEIIANEDGLSEAEDDEPVDLGDEAELTEIDWPDDNFKYGDAGTQIELEIVLDRLVLEVTAAEFEGSERDAVESETVVALGERLVERAQAALEGEAPALHLQALRLETDVQMAPYLTYMMLDGEPIRGTFESDDDFETRVADDQDDNIVSVLNMEQYLKELTEVTAAIRFYNTVLQFADEDDAVAYMDGIAEALSESYSKVEELDVDQVGDQSALISLEYERGEDGPTQSLELFVRMGDIVTLLFVDRDFSGPAFELDEDTLLELGELQAECIEDNACTEPAPLPDGLADLLDSGNRPERNEEEDTPADETAGVPSSDEDDDAPADEDAEDEDAEEEDAEEEDAEEEDAEEVDDA